MDLFACICNLHWQPSHCVPHLLLNAFRDRLHPSNPHILNQLRWMDECNFPGLPQTLEAPCAFTFFFKMCEQSSCYLTVSLGVRWNKLVIWAGTVIISESRFLWILTSSFLLPKSFNEWHSVWKIPQTTENVCHLHRRDKFKFWFEFIFFHQPSARWSQINSLQSFKSCVVDTRITWGVNHELQ